MVKSAKAVAGKGKATRGVGIIKAGGGPVQGVAVASGSVKPCPVTWSSGRKGAVCFAVKSPRHVLPITGALWEPSTKAVATVYLQHGSTGDALDNPVARSAKLVSSFNCTGAELQPYVLAQKFVELGFAVVSLDGPCHGRRDPTKGKVPVKEQWAKYRKNPDWQLKIEHDYREVYASLKKEGKIDPKVPAGFWGCSMGGVIGTTVVARKAVGNLKAAVLGKCGNGKLTDSMTPQIKLPVMYRLQVDDEHVTKERALKYFQNLASKDKRILAFPGAHSGGPDCTIGETVRFIQDKLGVSTMMVPEKKSSWSFW